VNYERNIFLYFKSREFYRDKENGVAEIEIELIQ